MRTAVLSLTRGEASTLGADVEDLAAERSRELVAAAAALGARVAGLHDHPDGSLETVPMVELAGEVVAAADEVAADLLLVFDPGGVTGHPDHRRATEAALVAAGRMDRPVLAWTLPADVAEALNRELSTGFVGVDPALVDLELHVDRAAQLAAIACHGSQSEDNPVLRRRLELQGGVESTRWLRRTSAVHPSAPPTASGVSGTGRTARTGPGPEGSQARQDHGGAAGSTGDGLVAATIETT
jgi:LmbE family N-acetylglucosaminyl deacetylase